jgi:hypothetical protein
VVFKLGVESFHAWKIDCPEGARWRVGIRLDLL